MTEALPQDFWVGVEQFNHRQFYACHDTLEALWMEAAQPDKPFYQGILQLAVSLYHLSNQNWRGAVILMGEGINRLRSYSPEYGDIDVDRLIDQSAHLLKTLQQMGAEKTIAWLQSPDSIFSQNDLSYSSETSGDLCLPTIYRTSE